MAHQGLQKVHDLLLLHRTRIDAKVEVPHREPSRYRQTLPIEVVLQDGCLSARRPSATTMRSLAQSAFVDEDQDAPFPERFFLRAGHTFFFQIVDLLFIAFPCSPHRPLRAPAQTDQNLPDMALVIAHAELLLDQVGHTRARPQRRFIAEPLGTCEQ